MAAELPIMAFPSGVEWHAWLTANHATSPGILLKIARKGTGIATVTPVDAVEIALCFGWIDSQGRSLDDTHWLLRYTPRGPRSRWSKINRATAERLIDDGRMTPAGMAAVEAARADGRWDRAYDPPSTATVPDDLQAALDAEPAAAGFFATLDSQNRFAEKIYP